MKKERLSLEEKRLIAKWINQAFGHPDEDGFMGTTVIPEDIMSVYRNLFPKAWD